MRQMKLGEGGKGDEARRLEEEATCRAVEGGEYMCIKK
jgi:hypothetical protein